ncbi:MAG: hypothetical protein ACRD7E_19250 [Bryobacteraceae bacterium]
MLQETQLDGVAEAGRVPLGHRLIFACIGLLAGEVVMTVLVRPREMLLYYVIAAAIGWAFIGLPIVLPVPSRVVSRLPWLLVLIFGAVLGPLALLVIFITSAVLQDQSLDTFSLAHTESLWPTASFVSVVSVAVYSDLVRLRSQRCH